MQKYQSKYTGAQIDEAVGRVLNGESGSTPNGDYEVVSNKTTTLSSASTNTQYPSALAVVNFVQTVLGGSIDEIDRLIGG